MSPYFEMAILPTKGCNPAPPIIREFSSGTKFRNGDTLLARITPCLENGKTAYINCLPNDQVAWGSTEFIVMRSKSPLPAEYTYLLARDENFRAHAIKSMTGTSGRQRVQTDTLGKYKICIPPEEVAQKFGQCVSPMFRRIAVLSKESNILSQIRDTLLPRLISGKLRVGEISETVEALAL
jgi:type I restriction enzyme S subunit